MTYSAFDLALAFLQAGELADALDALNQHLAAQPADDQARRTRIGVLRHLGDEAGLRQALADFDHLTEPTPEDVMQQAALWEQIGQRDRAREVLAQACERWPEQERLTERYLNLLLGQGCTDEALVMIRQQPRTWRWLQWEGDALVACGDDITATARYNLALAQLEDQITPGSAAYFAPIKARLLLACAGAYRRLDMFDQAEAQYALAASIMPDDPTIRFNQGLIRWLLGHTDAALQLCHDALNAASPRQRVSLLDALRHETDCAPLLKRLSGFDDPD